MQTLDKPLKTPRADHRHHPRSARHRHFLADLAQFAGDNRHRYEILDGDLIVSAAPGRPHGAVAVRLSKMIEAALAHGKPDWCLFIQPINLELETDATTFHCEPDLSIFDRPLQEVANDETVPPVIVIEIVSPGNPENDYVRKVQAYAAMAIPEYWIVDPGQQTATLLILDETTTGAQYRQQIRSSLLPEAQLDPAELFEGI